MGNWYRKRRKAPRKQTRLKVAGGMTMKELAAKVGVTARTVRYYTAERVLAAPEFRGTATRYSREHLVCLAAIRWLQKERRMSLPAIRQYLRTADRTEVERVAAALLPELAAVGAAAAPSAQVPSVAAAAVSGAELVVSDTWHRLAILPGLEVHVHSTASVEVKNLARAVVERIRGRAAQ